MDMQFLYFLEKIRNSVLDTLMLLVTQLGEETAFLVLALIVFWCVDKYKGYFILGVGFIGTILNQFLKLWFRIPRPWIIDENFTILEQAREAASGYSFPSGHTQSAVGTFGALAYTEKNSWIRWSAIAVAILVPFSRMYIGVHTPLDVFVSIAVAVLLIVILKPLVLDFDHRCLRFVIGAMVLIGAAFMCFVHLYPFPADIDAYNLESGYKNAYTLVGSLAGLLVVYIVDEKWLKFKTDAPFIGQCLKVFLGLCVVLVVKSGLKAPLNLILGESFGRAVRYCLVVIVAGVLWPMSFRFFRKMGQKSVLR